MTKSLKELLAQIVNKQAESVPTLVGGSTGTTAKTVASTSDVTLVSGTATFNKGSYIFFTTVTASWTQASYQFALGLKVGSNTGTTTTTNAAPQGTAPVVGFGWITIPATGTYTWEITARVTHVNKSVTVPSYQTINCILFPTN